jgi:hypothetical protein
MGRHVVAVMGIFNESRDAEHAIAGLKSLGVTTDEIMILAHPDAIPSHKKRNIVEPKNGTSMTTAGLVATLVGIGLCAIPLAGLLTAPPLLVAGGVASVTGRNRPIDDLRDMGIPMEDSQIAIESVRRGGIAVIARVDRTYARRCADVLARAGAIDFHARAAEWEAEGWIFEPNAPPYTSDQIRRERSPVTSQPPVMLY